MKAKTHAKSRILKAAHETARDLNSAGLLGKRRMRQFDALCLPANPGTFSQIQKAFIERGMASAKAARKSGKYVPAATVIGKLVRKLKQAQKARSSRRCDGAGSQ